MKHTHILLGHGSGGRLSHELITKVFLKHFGKPAGGFLSDAAVLNENHGQLAFTTDGFVVDPLFFPGGDIGKLAVAGTVNDLAVCGAEPLALSAAFIIEEGLPLEVLEKVVLSMANEAAKAGVRIVAGDTKVVERGKADKLFITTSGVGRIMSGAENIASAQDVQPGDLILINGSIGDHGMAVMTARSQLNIGSVVQSDCACLHELCREAIGSGGIHFMRDATRGGLAAVLAELCENRPFGIDLYEEKIPVSEGVRGMCELLGFDPLHVANEGKVVIVVAPEKAQALLENLQFHPLASGASIIGKITEDHDGKIWLHTQVGGKRLVDLPAGEQLPRIC
ncbi:MAG: hydrogenase expression/formation protein HypE [Bacteroidia bacterium]|jgi:hydrogenase expression/formation protein HypE|nr:hydrogenase expression/formation protein HypE [Bacteroidia bacterium]